MYKRIRPFVALLCILVLGSGVWPYASGQAEGDRLLVVYDQGNLSQETPPVAAVSQVLAFMGKDVDYRLATEPIAPEEYAGVIVCLRPGSSLPQETAEALERAEQLFLVGSGGLKELAEEWVALEGNLVASATFEDGTSQSWAARAQGSYVLAGEVETVAGSLYSEGSYYPLCAKQDALTYLAYFDSASRPMTMLLATLITQWLWPYESPPHKYGAFLVLDNMYPFEDLEKMKQLVAIIREQGLPFAITVMPVYDNGSYPSMKRFCEFLRYAQSQGAAIVLRSPLVRLNSVEPEEVIQRLTLAYEIYLQYGIFPIALEAPDYYAFTEEGLEILRRFHTVLLFETDGECWTGKQRRNLSYADGHLFIAPAYSSNRNYTSAYSQAIYIDVHRDPEDIKTQVTRLRNSHISFSSLWHLGQSVYMGDHGLQVQGGEVILNGKPESLAYEPFTYDDDYQYDRGFVQYMTEQIENSNHMILTFVGVAVGLFILMILTGRRQTRRKLLKRYKAAPATEQAQDAPGEEGVSL